MTFAAALSGLGVVVLIAIVAVVATPVRLRVVACSEPAPRVRLLLGLLGGWIPSIAVVDSARRDRSRRETDRAPRERPRKRRERRTADRTRLARIRKAAPTLVRDLLRTVRLERLLLRGQVGLDDPADTGRLYGLVVPVLFATRWAWPPSAVVSVTPVFDRACLEGEADIALEVVPVRLLPPALRFGWAVFGART